MTEEKIFLLKGTILAKGRKSPNKKQIIFFEGFDTTFGKSCVELTKEEINLLVKGLSKLDLMTMLEYDKIAIIRKKLEDLNGSNNKS